MEQTEKDNQPRVSITMDAKTTEPFVEGQEITYGLRAPLHPHLTVLRKRKGTQRVINVLP